MKKILSISFILILLSAAASAQRPGDNIRRHYVKQGFSNGQITRGERFELRKDVFVIKQRNIMPAKTE